MNQKKTTHTIDSLFTFLLLLAFLLFSLLLAGTGSVIYRNGAESLNENYTSRTALSYISEKIRQHDESGAVFETSIGDLPALGLRKVLNGEEFLTYIYYYDGALRELFTRASTSVSPDMGSPVVELSACSIEPLQNTSCTSGQMLEIHAADPAGTEQSMLVHSSTWRKNGDSNETK